MKRFERVRWTHAIRPARSGDVDGWSLAGPAGDIAERVRVATTPGQRAKGLLGRRHMDPDEALVIRPCSGIHTIGMRFPIDAVFCTRDLTVLRVVTLPPGRMSPFVRRSACCIELAAGRAESAGIAIGAQLALTRRTP